MLVVSSLAVQQPAIKDDSQLPILEKTVSDAKALENTLNTREQDNYNKVRQIDKAYCDIFDYYFNRNDITKAVEYFVARRLQIMPRGWSYGTDNCTEKRIKKIADYYYSKSEYDSLIGALNKITDEYVIWRYFIDKNDKAKARKYLDERIALGEGALIWKRGFEELLRRRAALSKDFGEYKKLWGEILKYRESKNPDEKVERKDYYANTGQIEKAIQEYEKCQGCEKNKDAREQYDFLVANRNVEGDALGMYFWSQQLGSNQQIEMEEKIIKQFPDCGIRKTVLSKIVASAEHLKMKDKVAKYKKILDEVSLKEYGKEYAYNGPKFPFINLNNISDIQRAGNEIVFYAQNGIKRYDVEKKRWSYGTKDNAGSIFENKSEDDYYFFSSGRQLNWLKNDLPSWIPRSTYVSIVNIDDPINPKWVITALAGEGANYHTQDFVDVENRWVYRFPFEEIKSFLVQDNEIWLGSSFGIVNINRQTGERTDYLTYPAYWSIDGVYQSKKYLYFITSSYGFYSVDKESGEISGVEKVNKICRKTGIKLLDMIGDGENIYIVGCPMDETNRFLANESAASIIVYNERSDDVNIVTTGINYADSLLDKGDLIIGYGGRTEGYEGGGSAAFGGVFTYNKKDRSIKVLADQPVEEIKQGEKKLLLKSMIFDREKIWLRELVVSDGEDVAMVETDKHIVAFGQSADEAEYQKQVAIYNEIKAKKKNRVDIEQLKKLRVQFKTVSMKKGKIEILRRGGKF